MVDSSEASQASDSVRVVYQHARFIGIHKPAGMPFHSEDAQRGVVAEVRTLMDNPQLYPVHRLDRLTSGLMLFATDREANSTLSQLFEQRLVDKTYLALSANKPKKKQGQVIGDMAKTRRGAWKLLRSTENPARTRFVCVRQYAPTSQQLPAPDWAFALFPKTGQTHQLRVAMKSLGAPILGDQRYGGGESDRGYLHAWRLRFRAFEQDFELHDPYFIGARVAMDTLLSLLQSKLQH